MPLRTTGDCRANLHLLGSLISGILGNLQLARQALASGATDQPIGAWLRAAEQDARAIEALRRELIGAEDA